MYFKKYIMIVIVSAMILSLTGCEEEIKKASQVDTYMDLVRVCSDDSEAIYYDNNTGVMYYRILGCYGSSAMTPIYNTDGTVKIYDKWQ